MKSMAISVTQTRSTKATYSQCRMFLSRLLIRRTKKIDLRKANRICLFGFFGGGNFGNDGSLEAILSYLRNTQIPSEVICICEDPGKVRQRFGISAISMNWQGFSGSLAVYLNRIALRIPGTIVNWVRTFRYVREFDVLLVPGTGLFCDFRTGPFGPPYSLFRWSLAAKMFGVELFLISIGAGPIRSELTRWMLKIVARTARYRSFRDHMSKKHIKNMGVDCDQDEVFPDLVFNLRHKGGRRGRAWNSQRETVGIGLMYYWGWDSSAPEQMSHSRKYGIYRDKIILFVTNILERGYNVRFLIGEYEDCHAVNDIVNRLKKKGYRATTGKLYGTNAQITAKSIESLHDVMEEIDRCDIVVATRYHNVVCALKAARPTVSIGYEPKNAAVMTEAGLRKFSQDIDEFNVRLLDKQVEELLAHKVYYQQAIMRKLADNRIQMARQLTVLGAALFS